MQPPVNFPYLIHIMFFAIIEYLFLSICYQIDVRCKAMRTRTYKSPSFFFRYKRGKRISRLSFWLQVVNVIFVLVYVPIAILEFNYQFNRIVLAEFTLAFIFAAIGLIIILFFVDPVNFSLGIGRTFLSLLWLWAEPLYGDPYAIIDEVSVQPPSTTETSDVSEKIVTDTRKKVKRGKGLSAYEFGWHSSPASVLKKRYCKKCGKELLQLDVQVQANKDTEEGLNYYKTLSARYKTSLDAYMKSDNIEFRFKKLFCYGCKTTYDYATVESLEVLEKIFARVTKYFAKRKKPITIDLAYETWSGEIVADTNDFAEIAYTCAIVTRLDTGRSEFFKFKMKRKVSFDRPYVVRVNEEKLVKSIKNMFKQ